MKKKRGMAQERLVAYFSGSVQGVGFRYTTLWQAKDSQIAGTVKNLRDGRVEVVAEGTREELTEFLQRIETRFKDYIRDAQVTYGPATGEFDGFEIRY